MVDVLEAMVGVWEAGELGPCSDGAKRQSWRWTIETWSWMHAIIIKSLHISSPIKLQSHGASILIVLSKLSFAQWALLASVALQTALCASCHVPGFRQESWRRDVQFLRVRHGTIHRSRPKIDEDKSPFFLLRLACLPSPAYGTSHRSHREPATSSVCLLQGTPTVDTLWHVTFVFRETNAWAIICTARYTTINTKFTWKANSDVFLSFSPSTGWALCTWETFWRC